MVLTNGVNWNTLYVAKCLKSSTFEFKVSPTSTLMVWVFFDLIKNA